MRKYRLAFAVTGAWLMTAPLAFAHHSFAMFDMQKVVDVKGTVTEFHWTNPHSWIVLKTRDATGKVSDISIEANGPGYLVKQGWKRETLKAGDEIVASINPLHDGSGGGSLVKVTFSDGRAFSAMPNRTPGGGGAPAPAPTAAPGGAGAKQ